MGALDLTNVAQAGWGVVIHPEVDDDIRQALKPLLALRAEQASFDAQQSFDYRPGESAPDFLARYGASMGGYGGLPYYLLLVGSFEQIPYHFQGELSRERAVGRLWFDDPEVLQRYVARLTEYELNFPPPGRLVFFAPSYLNDPVSQGLEARLVGPLVETTRTEQARRGQSAESVLALRGDQAQRVRLISLLTDGAPSLLVAAGHSLIYPNGHEQQRARQGGLICHNWQGPGGGESPEAYALVGEQVTFQDLSGQAAVLLASYSLATPGQGQSSVPASMPAPELPQQPFVACLAQNLLGAGAVGVLGMADRLWSGATLDENSPFLQAVNEMVASILRGEPLGWALTLLKSGILAVNQSLNDGIQSFAYGAEVDTTRLAQTWMERADLENLTLLGDPAARLASLDQAAVQVVSRMVAQTTTQAKREAELIINLSRGPSGAYLAELRLMRGDEAIETASVWGEISVAWDRLKVLESKPSEYGRALSEALFRDPRLLQFMVTTLALVQAANLRLDVKITIDSEAADLNALWWETLAHPDSGASLTASEGFTLTRLVPQSSWRPIELHPLQKPRALVVVTPYIGNKFDIDELELARRCLGEGVEIVELAGPPGSQCAATPNRLAQFLEQGFDILYLVGWMMTVKATEQPVLIMQNEAGKSALQYPTQVSAMIRNLPVETRPRLAVIIAAFNGMVDMPFLPNAIEQVMNESGQFVSLVASLMEGGLPAVLTLQSGDNTARTRFLETFFRELWCGQPLHVATASARWAIPPGEVERMLPPALFTHIRSGRLWLTAEEKMAGASDVPTREAEANVLPEVFGLESAIQEKGFSQTSPMFSVQSPLGDEPFDTLLDSLDRVEAELKKGDWATARLAMEWADEQVKLSKFLFERTPSAATHLHHLGVLRERLGRWGAAREALEAALSIRQEIQRDSLETAAALNALGELLLNDGKYGEGLKYLLSAVTIQERLLGPDHPDLAASLSALGWAIQLNGDLAGAGECYQQALAILRRAFGADSAPVAAVLRRLGMQQRELGNLEAARASLEQSVGIEETLGGSERPELIAGYQAMSLIARDGFRFDEARLYLSHALTIAMNTWGPSHPQTGSLLFDLGNLSVLEGNADEAVSLYEQAAKVYHASLPDNHPTWLALEKKLANTRYAARTQRKFK